jgi:hypothetical protein
MNGIKKPKNVNEQTSNIVGQDATQVLEQWKDGVRKFNANSRTYGDPCPGIKKALFIIWSVNGKMFSGTSIDWDNTWFELSGLE